MPDPDLSRRAALRAVAVTGASALASQFSPAPAMAQTPPTTAPASSPTTSPATAPTTSPSGISPDDVAVVDRVAGRTNTPEHRAQMAGTLTGRRTALRAIRTACLDLPDDTAPATRFEPHLTAPEKPLHALVAAFVPSDAPAPAYDGNIESLAFASLLDLGRLLRAKKITSLALTQMYLARLKRIAPALNCLVTLTEPLALAQAARADTELAAGKDRGPLHGIPWGAKDLLATKDYPTTWGIAPYKNRILDEDATVVRKLNDAGAVLIAKLSLGELAMGDIWFGGMTRSPWNTLRGSSGSGAGPAAAVAAGLVAFAIGTETLGSIVSPSCVNGTTGLRPTFGAVSRAGAMPLSWTMDKIGPMTRTVEDAAAVFHAIAGPDPLDATTRESPSFSWNPALDLKTLRIGLDTESFAAFLRTSPDQYAAYAAVLDVIKSLGLTTTPIALPRSRVAGPIANIVIGVEGAASFNDLIGRNKLDQLVQQHPGAWPNTFRSAEAIPAPDYVRALRLRSQLQQQMHDALKDVDLYITIPRVGPSLTLTNLTGHPTLVTRCGLAGDQPLMIEFTGQLHAEPTLCAVALAFERATPHHTHWPDTSKLPTTAPTP